MFDINEFMNEVDILLNDYTTTSTDFALLNRPQIFLCLIMIFIIRKRALLRTIDHQYLEMKFYI